MRRIGTVTDIAQRRYVLRAFEGVDPVIGTSVIDAELETIGRVVDVIGPVDRPYLVLDPTETEPDPAMIGKRVYSRADPGQPQPETAGE